MNDIQATPIPRIFCWTRFGPEAGEPVEDILQRKERERERNNGVFYWGIGNSVATGVAELIRRCEPPQVLFSPISGRPRPIDVQPGCVVTWLRGETLHGDYIELPRSVRVTSRGDASGAVRRYALVCKSEQPLAWRDFGVLSLGALSNLLSGRPVGASQVTAVVKHAEVAPSGGRPYRVAFRARLVPPYFVRLHEPTATG